MNRYFDVIYNMFAFAFTREVFYVPFLLVVSFCSLIAVICIIKYIVKRDN